MPTTVIKTIRASGGDYTTLSAWEAANQGNLVAADEVRVAECYNDWPGGLNDAVNVSGWTTDSSRYVKICAAAGHEHGGIPEAGFFLSKTTYGTDVVVVSQQYTRIEKIQVTKTGGTSGTALATNADNVSISGLLLKSTGTCVYAGVGGNISVESCAALSGTSGFTFASTRSGRTISNCVASNISGNGFSSTLATDVIVKNCVSYNNTTNWSGTFSASSSHNATSSASDDAPGSDSVWNISSSDFVDAASNDFHLASGSALIGAGANLYSTFTTDIDGDTWPSSGAWDIGFDYYITAGGGETLITASDSLTPSFTESQASFLTSSLTDTLLPSLTEVAALLKNPEFVTVSDALSISATEALALVAYSSSTDTLTPSLTETSSLNTGAVEKSVTETLAPSLTESQTSQLYAAVAEALTLTLGETQGSVLFSSVTDVIPVSISESVSLLVAVTPTDTLLVSITDSSSVLTAAVIAKTVTDTLAPYFTELGSIEFLDAWTFQNTVVGVWSSSSGASGSWVQEDKVTDTWTEDPSL